MTKDEIRIRILEIDNRYLERERGRYKALSIAMSIMFLISVALWLI